MTIRTGVADERYKHRICGRKQTIKKLQIWTMSAVLLNMTGQGIVGGYTFSLLPALNHPSSTIKVDLGKSSWLGSITSVANLPGFAISSVLMATYGRRSAQVLGILPSIVGWLMIYFAADYTTLMIGRFLCGFTTGSTVHLGAVIIGEYTAPKHRGLFLYLKTTTFCLGVLLVHLISSYLHWRTVALISLVPAIISLLMVFTWPESSAWLASNHQYERSEKSFYWLRGNSEAAKREIEEVIKTQKARLSKTTQEPIYWDTVRDFCQKFKQKDFRRPCVITIFASILMEVSGRHVFPVYVLQIVTEMTGEVVQSVYYSLAIDLTVLVSSTIGVVLIKMIDRRTLLFSSGFSAVLVLISVCLYLFLASKDIIPNNRPGIPVILLAVFFVLVNFGCGPMPLTLVGEIFPLAHRSAGSALTGVWASICLIVILKFTPHVLVSIGACGLFVVFGSLTAISLLVLYFILPETKDRTLTEIEYYFRNGQFASPTASLTEADNEANVKMII